MLTKRSLGTLSMLSRFVLLLLDSLFTRVSASVWLVRKLRQKKVPGFGRARNHNFLYFLAASQ